MSRLFLVPDEAGVATLGGEIRAADAVLPLTLEAALGCEQLPARRLGLDDVIPHQRVCDLAAEALARLQAFAHTACAGERLDGVDWPALLVADQELFCFRDLLFGDELGRKLSAAGWEEVIWAGAAAYLPGESRHTFQQALRLRLGQRYRAATPPARPLRTGWRRGLDAFGRLARRRRAALRGGHRLRPLVLAAVFATSEWERFTTPLSAVGAAWGDAFELWYLGPAPTTLRRWAAEVGLRLTSVPYPAAVDPDIAGFFLRFWERWQDRSKRPEMAAQAHFEQLFTYTLPRTAQWGRTLSKRLQRARPRLLLGSAAGTYLTAFPYAVAAALGIPSVALSHTYAPGDFAPLQASYLACRNEFERRGHQGAVPEDGRVLFCRDAANALSFTATGTALEVEGPRVVAVLTARPTSPGVLLPSLDGSAFLAGLRSLMQPPADLAGLEFVWKSHPRLDLAPTIARLEPAANVRALPGSASPRHLLERAWAVVVFETYGSIVAEAIATGKPLLFVDGSRFFYPCVETHGHAAGRVVRSVEALWAALAEIAGSPAAYEREVARCRGFCDTLLTPARATLVERLGRLVAADHGDGIPFHTAEPSLHDSPV